MIKQFFKKVLISYLIIICCIFTPTYNAYAASAGGWAFNSFDVAKSVVTALKGGVSASVAVAKSPISQKIGKGILGGVIAGAAIPLAISQISGIALEAVDWVLDPANNAIKYRDKTPAPAKRTYTNSSGGTQGSYASHDEAARAKCALAYNTVFVSFVDKGGYLEVTCNQDGYYYTTTLYYTDSAGSENEWKTIPIPTVADKVYDNAKTDSNSRSVVNDAVKDYVNEGSADTALDAAKADADATHNCGTGTYWNGSACTATPTDTPTDTPFDPTSIIDAIDSVFDAVMSLPDVINNALDDLLVDIKDFFQPVIDKVTDFFDTVITKFTDFVDWVKTPVDEKPNEPIDIQTPDMPQMESTDLNFGGQCPQNFDIDIDLFGKPVKFTLFDSNIFCQFLSDWIRIPVIFSASLVAVYILGGRRSD